MIFAEPPVTNYDLHFRLGRIPVRIHPFFWVSTLCLSFRPGVTLLAVALWLVAVFVSILVHELGHALAFQSFGLRPWITLYGFGGLASASSDDPDRDPSGKTQILVSAAGPFAGFAFAALVSALVLQLGYRMPFLRGSLGSGLPITSPALRLLLVDLMAINVLWGLVNLLPVHPLDGGQIALELSRARDPVHGAERSVWLSFFVGVAASVVCLAVFTDTFTTLLFGYLAYSSWLVLKRRYHTGFGSLRVVRWTRRRWGSWQKARHKQTIDASVAKELRSIDDADAATPDEEVDRVVSDLFKTVGANVKPGRRREKPGSGGQ